MSITDRLFETEKQLESMVEASGDTIPTPGERNDIVSHLDYIIKLLGTMVTKETYKAAKELMAAGYNGIQDRVEAINWMLASGEISGDVDFESLTVTENGEYMPGAGKAFGRVVVSTPEPEEFDMQINFTSDYSAYIYGDRLNLTSVNSPACTSIGMGGFAGCTSLTSVSFPACTSIGNGGFGGCTSLTSVSFPACTNIGEGGFGGCTSLTSVSFPACTNIGYNAFSSCIHLTSVSFNACTEIGNNAFDGCYNLISLFLTGSTLCTLAGSSAFVSTPIGGYSASAGQYGSIFVPASLVDQYKAASNWSYLSSRITAYVEI